MYNIAKTPFLAGASLTVAYGIAAAAPSSTRAGDPREMPMKVAGLPNTAATMAQSQFYTQQSVSAGENVGWGGLERHSNPGPVYGDPAILMGGGN
jgi:hypothetical protein